jgi:predicted CoA-binding protein
MTAARSVNAFVDQPAIALVGISRSGKKFGNFVRRELQAKGYRVYSIHQTASEIDGVRCYAHFADLPEPVHAVLVVVPPAPAIPVVREAAAAGIHHVWLQQGAESPAVLQVCRELGLDVVAGECILMFAHPTSYHKAHRWVNKLLGKLPAGA